MPSGGALFHLAGRGRVAASGALEQLFRLLLRSGVILQTRSRGSHLVLSVADVGEASSGNEKPQSQQGSRHCEGDRHRRAWPLNAWLAGTRRQKQP